jgi:hypothetical protein
MDVPVLKINKMNRNFKVGEEAIALSTASSPNQPRKKGRSYIVTNTMFCSTDGNQLINIDSTEHIGKSGHISCGCGKRHHGNGLAWTYANKFVHPDDIEERMNQAVNEEDYELASDLRDLNKEKHEKERTQSVKNRV